MIGLTAGPYWGASGGTSATVATIKWVDPLFAAFPFPSTPCIGRVPVAGRGVWLRFHGGDWRFHRGA